MHLYVGVRGHQDYLERFKNDLLAQYLPYRLTDNQMAMMQLGVRPIEFWEIVFPEEHLQTVLSMVQPQQPQGMFKFLAATLKRLLKLQSIPKTTLPAHPFIRPDSVGVMGFGIKKDQKVMYTAKNKDVSTTGILDGEREHI